MLSQMNLKFNQTPLLIVDLTALECLKNAYKCATDGSNQVDSQVGDHCPLGYLFVMSLFPLIIVTLTLDSMTSFQCIVNKCVNIPIAV